MQPIPQDLAQNILRSHFKLPDFRKGQWPILQSVFAQKDTLAVLPTGGGKSLCYQLPTVAWDGLVLVISPLIALMKDQVRGLKALGLRAGCLHTGQDISEKQQIFAELKTPGAFVLFISPERVQKPGFAQWIKTQPVRLFAIDESHCVSQWGPDFRPDYHKLTLLRELRPDVPILALTATATPQVLTDIARQLKMQDSARHVYGFYRPNLYYQVEPCPDDERKYQVIRQAVRQFPNGRILIYCGTRQQTETLSQALQQEFESVGFYHAGLSPDERTRVQNQMNQGQIRILTATNAFGMGIDYPDVRLVIHYQMPANIESFYQEMGRAGRDGQPSTCLLLYAKKDRGLQSYFIQQSKAESWVINQRWRGLEAITLFAEGGECRHAGILTYFRDTERIQACGHCDVCAPQSERKVLPPRFCAETVVKTKIKKSTAKERNETVASPEAELRASALKSWRKQYAQENDIPAFIVFSNKTLIDLANKNPASLEDLKKVYGLGDTKVEQLGAEILSVLHSCS